MGPIRLSRTEPRLHRDGQSFDPWKLEWTEGGCNGESDIVGPLEAIRWLYREAGARKVPVAVIGPREATPRQCQVAEALGRQLAEAGLVLVCGGKNGVMEAVCRGVAINGGLSIGLLPDEEWSAANDYVTVPLATGIGNARNAIIARASVALIAVGGGYGTISEMAFGLHYDRLVLALEDAPEIPGAIRCKDVDEAIDRVCRRILKIDGADAGTGGIPA